MSNYSSLSRVLSPFRVQTKIVENSLPVRSNVVSIREIMVFCNVLGDKTETAFPIKLPDDKKVGELRELITKINPISFTNTDAKDLVLWQVCISDEDVEKMEILNTKPPSDINIEELEGKVMSSRKEIKFYFPEDPVDEHIHIIIVRPQPPATTVGNSANKRLCIDNWAEYTTKDGIVDLPPILIEMLNDEQSKPEPRFKFKDQLDNAKCGMEITLPSLGQAPKYYGEGYHGTSFLVTEQMEEIWNELDCYSERSIKRVLSGPFGVGKSHLALFLAAKAYSKGWRLLYISDANELVKETAYKTGLVICRYFLKLNKDILTVADFKKIISGHFVEDQEIIINAAGLILTLLQQFETKTLLVVDEHGALFETEIPLPKRFPLLNPLMKLNSWPEGQNGTRVVLTGTAHAKFEREYLNDGFMIKWLIYVTPLSDFIFDKLLDMSNVMRSFSSEIKKKVKDITNNVPRELIKLEMFINDNRNSPIDESVDQFKRIRRTEFFSILEKYFQNDLNANQRYSQRHALAAMFLPRKEGEIEPAHTNFHFHFMDLGLVYRKKNGALVQYHPLCQAARGALLDLYKSIPLPRDVAISIKSGNVDGLKFEDALFQQLLRYQEVNFNATDLAGKNNIPLVIKFKHFRLLHDPPAQDVDDVLLRCWQGYPRFDFILKRMFIQVSTSDFTTHNSKSADITKAFVHPINQVDQRNQIEKYLDKVYGGVHKAEIDLTSRKFIVTKNGQAVKDFRIVYIRGSGVSNPNHFGKVKEFPDILHVSFDEIKTKLFGDLLEGWNL